VAIHLLDSYSFSFPAIRGVQAGKEYYVLMCPLKLIPKILIFDEEELHPKMRAQRVLNKARIPEIAKYILENPSSYVFSALTASVDDDVEFLPANDGYYNIGSLKISMSAKFVINDGQHRRAAIESALKVNPELGDETIPIVLFVDLGLKSSQQMFSDLNRYAIRTTKSLSILYDYRDPLALMVKEIILDVAHFKGLIEMEKSTISNRSTKIFTLSGIYQATKELLSSKENYTLSKQKTLASEFWHEIWKNFPEWQLARDNKISAAELRKDFINAHSIALVSIGRAGHYLTEQQPYNWQKQLSKLSAINWHRNNNEAWEGRVTIGGKISNSRNNVTLLTNYIKMVLDLPLTEEEQAAEYRYQQKAGAL